jgi:hypothetical protein
MLQFIPGSFNPSSEPIPHLFSLPDPQVCRRCPSTQLWITRWTDSKGPITTIRCVVAVNYLSSIFHLSVLHSSTASLCLFSFVGSAQMVVCISAFTRFYVAVRAMAVPVRMCRIVRVRRLSWAQSPLALAMAMCMCLALLALVLGQQITAVRSSCSDIPRVALFQT